MYHMMQWKCSDAACALQGQAPLAVPVAADQRRIGIEYAVECGGCKALCYPCHVCRGLIAIDNAHSGLLVCFQCGLMEILDKTLRKCLGLPSLAFEEAIEEEAKHRRALNERKSLEGTQDEEQIEEERKQLAASWFVNGQQEELVEQEKINLTMLKLLPSTSEASQEEREWMTSTIESFFQHRQLLCKLQEEARQAMLLESRLFQEKQCGALALDYSKQHWKTHAQHFEGLTQPYWQLIGKANAQLRRLYASAVELASKETKPEKKPQVVGWVNPRSRRRQQLLSPALSPPDNSELATIAEEIHLWRHMCTIIARACLPPTI